jgi:hypothetical protein
MSEQQNPETLPFEHPDVQAWVRESTSIVFRTGLIHSFNKFNQRLVDSRNVPPLRDKRPPGDEQVVAGIVGAIRAELPIVAYRSVGQYEAMEESQYLVKVDRTGKIFRGSLTNVAILDHKSRAILKIEREFSTTALPIVQSMLDRQDQLPWQPVLDGDTYPLNPKN